MEKNQISELTKITLAKLEYAFEQTSSKKLEDLIEECISRFADKKDACKRGHDVFQLLATFIAVEILCKRGEKFTEKKIKSLWN